MYENLKPQAALLDSLPFPALILASGGQIAAANPQIQDLLGDWILGRDCRMVLRQPDVQAAIQRAARDQSPQETTWDHTEGAVSTRYQLHLRPIAGGDGALVLVLEDTSHLGENALMRRGFVADVSHELRSPLTAIMGFIETLQGPARDDPGAQARFLDLMMREAARMNRLVSDLLSLSRLEAQERARPGDPVALHALLARVIETNAGAPVPITHALDASCTVPGDADQLTQVFGNLIENALKYGGGPKGVSVTMRAVARDPRLRKPAVEVAVRDFGPGIPTWHIPRLTERFYRVDDHRSRAQGGTGLGLAIVKHIINRHRGRLAIESIEGQGSTFTVILPIA